MNAKNKALAIALDHLVDGSMSRYRKEIIKYLSGNLHTGRRQDDVFQDWLELVRASLLMLPEHCKSAASRKTMAEDDGDTQALFERMRHRYGRPEFDNFAKAFGALHESAATFQDTVGDIYMEWGYPSKGSGQYFTPFCIASLMAQFQNTAQLVYDRMNEAVAAAEMDWLFPKFSPETPLASQFFMERFGAVVLPHYKPVTVCDPACGSGVMLLAVAASVPPWMNHFGFIQYSGQDIDSTCVHMAQINLMLYGMNGFGARCALALQGAEPRIVQAAEDSNLVPLADVNPQEWQQPDLLPAVNQ
jgi:hypothetical protein